VFMAKEANAVSSASKDFGFEQPSGMLLCSQIGYLQVSNRNFLQKYSGNQVTNITIAYCKARFLCIIYIVRFISKL
jgi:hypothetical protein